MIRKKGFWGGMIQNIRREKKFFADLESIDCRKRDPLPWLQGEEQKMG